jgi:hypothetical protein
MYAHGTANPMIPIDLEGALYLNIDVLKAAGEIDDDVFSVYIREWPVGTKLAAGAHQRICGHERLAHGTPELVISVQLLGRRHLCSPP